MSCAICCDYLCSNPSTSGPWISFRPWSTHGVVWYGTTTLDACTYYSSLCLNSLFLQHYARTKGFPLACSEADAGLWLCLNSEIVTRVSEMFSSRSRCTWINVDPLPYAAIASLVSKTLHRDVNECELLSRFVHKASSGNAFSARSILTTLQRQHMVIIIFYTPNI